MQCVHLKGNIINANQALEPCYRLQTRARMSDHQIVEMCTPKRMFQPFLVPVVGALITAIKFKSRTVYPELWYMVGSGTNTA